ncbi:MAG: MGMT family protein, partial [archaeon]|nr:MGMT family protein [archaeon]
MKTGNFHEKCYKILKKVPKGKVTTYKDIAKALHSKAYRAVGTAMNKNPCSPIRTA